MQKKDHTFDNFVNLKHLLRKILAGTLKLSEVIIVENVCRMNSRTSVQHKAFNRN